MRKINNKFRIRQREGDRKSKVATFSRYSHTVFIIIVAFGSVVTYMIARSLREEQGRSVELYMKIRDGMVVLDSVADKEVAEQHEHEDVVRSEMITEPMKTQKAAQNGTLNLCKDESPYLLVVIFSKDESLLIRDVIRDTWCKRKVFSGGRKMACLFAIGENLETRRYDAAVKEEALRHGDVILVPATDHVRNSTLKLMNVFNQVTKLCDGIKFVLRTEDDVIVNMDSLMERILPSKSTSKYAGGRCLLDTKPHRNEHSNFYVSYDEFPGDSYPPICYAMGYVLSGDLLSPIFTSGLRHKLLPLDDVFIGVTLDRLQVVPENLDGFLHVKSLRPSSKIKDVLCSNVIVHAHINTFESARDWWAAMRDGCVGA